MAINYGEAIEKAKLDEALLKSRAKVLGMTGEPRAARKAQRELKLIESWEEHCSREKQRFEKAARWMETHFDAVGKAVALEKVHATGEGAVGSGVTDDTRDRPTQDVTVD
jgi:hypothetical protein